MPKINCEELIATLEKRGVSRRRLARELDVSRSTVMRILAGKNCPSYFIAHGITEALDLSEQECLDIFFPHYSADKNQRPPWRPIGGL